MTFQHLDVLVVENSPVMHELIELQLEQVKESWKDDAQLHIRSVMGQHETFESIFQSAPDLIVLSFTEFDETLETFVRMIRANLMTQFQPIILITELLDDGLINKLTQLHGVSSVISFPFSRMGGGKRLPGSPVIMTPYLEALVRNNVNAAIHEILQQRGEYTGLPGGPISDRVVRFLLFKSRQDNLRFVLVFFDIRKLGLAVNDRFGRSKGNLLIKRLAELLQEFLRYILKEHRSLEAVAFQAGKGDEFIVAFASEDLSLRRLTRIAEKYSQVVGFEFFRQVRIYYRLWRFKRKDPLAQVPLLVGENVKDKSGRWALFLLPAARASVIPGYDEIKSPEDITAIELDSQARVKQVHSQMEQEGARYLGITGETFPEMDSQFFEKIDTLSQQFGKVGSTTDINWRNQVRKVLRRSRDYLIGGDELEGME